MSLDTGLYVAKRLSKVQFSPMIMMTCLIGVWVTRSRLLGPNDGPLGVAVAACAKPVGRLQGPGSSLYNGAIAKPPCDVRDSHGKLPKNLRRSGRNQIG